MFENEKLSNQNLFNPPIQQAQNAYIPNFAWDFDMPRKQRYWDTFNARVASAPINMPATEVHEHARKIADLTHGALNEQPADTQRQVTDLTERARSLQFQLDDAKRQIGELVKKTPARIAELEAENATLRAKPAAGTSTQGMLSVIQEQAGQIAALKQQLEEHRAFAEGP